MKRVVLIVLLMAVAGPAWGSDASGSYNILGLGTKSCGFWTTERKEPNSNPAFYMAVWLQGFLTGYNLYTPGVLDITEGTDAAGREAWMDNYCDDHPLKPFATGAEALVRHLKTR